ncbi:hypothetical protein [Pseudolactococcus reticulitermitis]|uniref:Uncharacterized protein n=1 Tax=Pseudolactococcus reticulitermitis TaxID=2025039 RepID=A0A224X8S6_9LACT|nr:hypothetical protein [Lactococcus reticulitermitis]GAX46422.1 hypothetical protein RsY01_01 [Lactococcus reticulitermitis]
MDTALSLKQRLRTEDLSEVVTQDLLNRSEIVNQLLNQKVRIDTFTGLRKMEFRLIELQEKLDLGLECILAHRGIYRLETDGLMTDD